MGDYLNNTTLHGLRYLNDPELSFGEKAFWLVCFLLAVVSAAYFVSLIYVTYDQTPVIVTTNPEPVYISEIPFPAITLCNINNAKRSIAAQIIKNGSILQKEMLNNYCYREKSATLNKTLIRQSNWQNTLNFILKVSPTCEDLLKVCIWKSVETSCKTLFNPILTDEGLCCSFNQMPTSYIFRYKSNFNQLPYTYPLMVVDWNQEVGYPKGASDNVFPLRALGPGVDFGLTLVLDAQVDEYFCVHDQAVGFKMVLYNPIEIQSVTDFGVLVPLGQESWFDIVPTIKETSLDLKSTRIDKRMCYFYNERHLKFFRDAADVICSFADSSCNMRADIEMQMIEVGEEAVCNCLTSCFDLSFGKRGYYGSLQETTIQKALLKNKTREYFVKNEVVVHLYYEYPMLDKYIKREMYKFSEFLSNTGGLLGLFLGFSFLTGVELVYYLSLHLVCSINRSKTSNNKKSSIVYPFVN